VPPERVARLIDALQHLRLASTALPRASLDALGRALAATRAAPGRSIEVEAPRAVLRELLAVAIDEAGETLGGSCTALLRGGSLSGVHSGLAELDGLVELLETVDAAA
jgi:hypothetical protein